jgi:hypothetical protein
VTSLLLHALIAAGVAGVVVLLLIGYRDSERLDLPTQLVALTAMLTGMLSTAVWEVLEFFLDWVRYTDLQTSNTESMLDMLAGNVGAVLGALLLLHAYAHWLDDRQRAALGEFADGLWAPTGDLLDQRGGLFVMAALAVFAVIIGGLWLAGGRQVPGLPFD